MENEEREFAPLEVEHADFHALGICARRMGKLPKRQPVYPQWGGETRNHYRKRDQSAEYLNTPEKRLLFLALPTSMDAKAC